MSGAATMRVLVSGASGFTGKYMSAYLKEAGYKVFGFGSSDAGIGDEYRKISLLDLEGLKEYCNYVKPDFVVHLAAVAYVAHGNVDDIYDVNIKGTRNLLDALSRCSKRPRSILVASSANVYGNQEARALRESDPLFPENDYAVSKYAMEALLRIWKRELNIIVARPFNYSGVGQSLKFLVPKIVNHFQDRKKVIQLGNVDVFRDFSDVRSVVDAYKGLLETPDAVGKTLNICSGRAISVRDIIGFCESICGYEIDIEVDRSVVRSNELKYLCGDNTELRKLLPDWQPIDFSSTLSWMLE